MALFPDSESNWPKSKNHTLLSLSEKQPASQSLTKHTFCVCMCSCVYVGVGVCTWGGGEISDCAPKTLSISGVCLT
jgi:hypothetical protein